MRYVHKGTSFARLAIAKAANLDGGREELVAFARHRWGSDAATIVKATVVGGTIADPAFGSLAEGEVAAAFLELVSEISVVGRLPLRRVPIDVRLILQTAGASAGWRTEGKAKALRAMAFTDSTMRAKVVQALAVVSDDVLQFASIDAEEMVRADLTRAVVAALDQSFLDPSNAGNADTPASITNGVTPVSGSSDERADLKALAADFAGDLSRAWFVARPEVFAGLSGANHPAVGLRGGELLGAPAIATRHAPADRLILVDPDRILYGAGSVDVKASKQASIEMDSEPTSSINTAVESPVDTAPPTGDVVSLWQSNATGVLVELQANWSAGAGAVSMLDVSEWNEEPEE